MPDTFEAPTVSDYGNLLEMTEAIGPCGDTDGASFNQPNHHTGACGP